MLGGLPARLLILSAFAALMYVLVGRLPESGTVRIDALAGFAVALLLLGTLAWTLVAQPRPPLLLAGLAVGGLATGLALSAAGFLGLAAPCKVVGAVALGYLLGRQLDRAWLLLLVAVLVFAADIWSVFAGPTRVIVERAPGFLDYALVHFPALGHQGPGTALGMSDWVFLALFTVGSRMNGLRPRAAFAAMVASLFVTFTIAMITGRALPALPLLGLAFVAANLDLFWRRRPWTGRPGHAG